MLPVTSRDDTKERRAWLFLLEAEGGSWFMLERDHAFETLNE